MNLLQNLFKDMEVCNTSLQTNVVEMSVNLPSLEKVTKTKRMKTLICYVCEKEFNAKKIEEHLRLCRLLTEKQEPESFKVALEEIKKAPDRSRNSVTKGGLR
jgi:hypothetical protein